MSHEGGPEQPQRTVAELLAKYGAESGNQPRRRRRRADDMNDTGAQQIIERVLSESGEMQAIRDDMPPPERTSHRRGAPPPDYQRQPEPRRRQPLPPQPGQQSSQHIPRPLPPQPSQQPRPNPGPGPGQQSSSRMPQPGRAPAEPTARGYLPQPSQQLPRPQQSQRVPLPPPAGGTRDRSGIRPRLDSDAPPPPSMPPMSSGASAETTEELPRVPGRVPVDGSMTGRRPAPGGDSRTQISPVYPPQHDPYADMPPDEDDYRAPYPAADPDDRYDTGERYPADRYDSAERRYETGEYDDLVVEDDRRRLDDDDLDELEDLEDDDLDDEPRERSAVGEWVVMIGQLALGVIGGAAVWLGFNWLWGFLPAAALVVALVVTTGLVLIVRKIRRAEDLQTTVLAVLVGLVVTVSPAALLLLNR
ncbi:hypothetical protein [Actinophytocola oryzae]|uniref:Uncharacterized protein n=1 Tax=Actinophytocola oryzae TaxID=502181 RepID=A0A4R7VCW9_9PSEU|nr:hypothetical protein [Actinophytocola oryzae]TDV46960.1 hypothetical protein CLV71_110143 [Actinophytocola oryzae]